MARPKMASIEDTHFNGYEEDLELWGFVMNGLVQLEYFTTKEEAEAEADKYRMKPKWLNAMNPYRPVVFKVGDPLPVRYTRGSVIAVSID